MSARFPTPSVAEERAHAMHLETPWRSNGTLLRIVFFALAALAVLAAFGLFSLLHMPKGILTAALAIGTAEYLIRQYRFFGTGLEQSLWLCGTFAFIFGLPSEGKVEALLVFAAAAALSGWRMRNRFSGVLAAVLIVAYVALKWDHSRFLPMLAGALIAVAAAVACRRLWQRPSTERLFAGLVVTMPVAGFLGSTEVFFRSELHADVSVAATLGATALILLVCGIAWRDRVLLLSAAIATALTTFELRELFDYPSEGKLIAGGAIMIIIAVIVSRALRNATRGFVVTPIAAGAYDEAIQIAGIISIAPHDDTPTHEHTGPELADSTGPTDKSFGGAGAGGGF
jgi:hypothetical protein